MPAESLTAWPAAVRPFDDGVYLPAKCRERTLFMPGQSSLSTETHGGGCLCGGVRYLISGPLRGIVVCHCSQCRRTSGHYAAMTSAPSASITIAPTERLR